MCLRRREIDRSAAVLASERSPHALSARALKAAGKSACSGAPPSVRSDELIRISKPPSASYLRTRKLIARSIASDSGEALFCSGVMVLSIADESGSPGPAHRDPSAAVAGHASRPAPLGNATRLMGCPQAVLVLTRRKTRDVHYSHGIQESVYSAASPLRSPGTFLRQAWGDLKIAVTAGRRVFVREFGARYRQTQLRFVWLFLPAAATTLTWTYLGHAGVT